MRLASTACANREMADGLDCANNAGETASSASEVKALHWSGAGPFEIMNFVNIRRVRRKYQKSGSVAIEFWQQRQDERIGRIEFRETSQKEQSE